MDPEQWSDSNLERLRRLLPAGRMQPAGLAVVSKRVLRIAEKPQAKKAPRK
ncbi:MAG: hypothetical protein KC776_15640 [Myxococcales bacterium]|nr:hypothetical protein [Myxococcales bacterium]MCB9578314.1 hypothetical protein [Polyangiaceae bacterium]